MPAIFVLFMVTALLMLFEHTNYIAQPGTWVYENGFPVRRVTIPVLDRERWSSYLQDNEFLIGTVDERKNEVFVRRPKGQIRWFYNPFIGQIRLSKPDTLIVRFSPVTAINWFIWHLCAFVIFVPEIGEPGALSGLIAVLVLGSLVVYGHYWFFTSNTVDAIEEAVRRRRADARA